MKAWDDPSITLDAGILGREDLAKVSAILKRPRFSHVSLKRRPVRTLGHSHVTLEIRGHSFCESQSTESALREEMLEARIPGFFSYCDNCYSADLSEELGLGKRSDDRPCSYPERCIGRQKFPCPHCGRVCEFEELERTAGACCSACEP